MSSRRTGPSEILISYKIWENNFQPAECRPVTRCILSWRICLVVINGSQRGERGRLEWDDVTNIVYVFTAASIQRGGEEFSSPWQKRCVLATIRR